MVEPRAAALDDARRPRGQGAAQRLGRAALARLARRGLAARAGGDRSWGRGAGARARARRRVRRSTCRVDGRLRDGAGARAPLGRGARPCRASPSTSRSPLGRAHAGRPARARAAQPTDPTCTPGAPGSRPRTSGPTSWPGRARPARRGRASSRTAETAGAPGLGAARATTRAGDGARHGDVDQKNLLRRCPRAAAHRLGRRAARRTRARPRARRGDDGAHGATPDAAAEVVRGYARPQEPPSTQRRATSVRRSRRAWAGSASPSTAPSMRTPRTGRGRPPPTASPTCSPTCERRVVLAESWPDWLEPRGQ